MRKKISYALITLLMMQPLSGCSRSEPAGATGLKKAFYPGGQLESEKTYANGQLDGPCRIYYENGQLAMEGNYLNGKLDGRARFFYESGILQAERIYLDGIQTGQAKIYTPSGAHLATFTMENGRKSGKAIYYYQNGAVLKTVTYLNGVKDGPEAIFGRSGEIKSMHVYVQGKLATNQLSPTQPQPSGNPLPQENRIRSVNEAVAKLAAEKTAPVQKNKLPTPEELLQAAARSAKIPADVTPQAKAPAQAKVTPAAEN